MEDELVIGSDGCYCLCINNSDSLSEDMLREIFSEYGNVVSINRSNNLAFVRYTEYNEAKATFDQFKHHPFKARMAHNKSSNSKLKFDDGRSFTDRTSPDSRYNKGQNFTDRDNGNNRHGYSNANGRHVGSGKMTQSVKSDEGKDALPPLKYNEEALPTLVPRGDVAKLLIIGNLPRTAMQGQIYRLCKTREVLQVDVYTSPSNITQAYVYLKTDADVDALVTDLDTLEIDGKKLVAISAKKLLS